MINIRFLSAERRINGTFSGQEKIAWTKTRELLELCSSPNIRRIIKSLMVRCAGNVARKGRAREAFKMLVEEPEGRTITLNTQTYVGGRH